MKSLDASSKFPVDLLILVFHHICKSTNLLLYPAEKESSFKIIAIPVQDFFSSVFHFSQLFVKLVGYLKGSRNLPSWSWFGISFLKLLYWVEFVTQVSCQFYFWCVVVSLVYDRLSQKVRKRKKYRLALTNIWELGKVGKSKFCMFTPDECLVKVKKVSWAQLLLLLSIAFSISSRSFQNYS